MSEVVLDSSAVLAMLLAEPGSERVAEVLPGALLSTVNLAEVVSKLTERGVPSEEAGLAVEALGLTIVPFDADQAMEAGALRTATQALGLSLGDRACVALARRLGAIALTADRSWGGLRDERIVVIR